MSFNIFKSQWYIVPYPLDQAGPSDPFFTWRPRILVIISSQSLMVNPFNSINIDCIITSSHINFPIIYFYVPWCFVRQFEWRECPSKTYLNPPTHPPPLAPHICVAYRDHHWFKQWVAACWCQAIIYRMMICYQSHAKEQTLTHRGRVTHICVSKITIIGSDNGLSPGRRQAIIWTSVGILLVWHLETNFTEIVNEIYTYSFKKIHLKMSSGK